MKGWLIAYCSVIGMETVLVTALTIYDNDNANLMTLVASRPLPDTIPVKVAYVIMFLLASGAWLLPIMLCAILTQSLSYIFDEYYRYVKNSDNTNCCRRFVHRMRTKFVDLTTLCGDADDMLSFLCMCSYLTDIVAICLLMRIIVFTITDPFARVVMVIWVLIPLFTLLVMSHHTSSLAEKVNAHFSLSYAQC